MFSTGLFDSIRVLSTTKPVSIIVWDSIDISPAIFKLALRLVSLKFDLFKMLCIHSLIDKNSLKHIEMQMTLHGGCNQHESDV